jgi:hypothetical protein
MYDNDSYWTKKFKVYLESGSQRLCFEFKPSAENIFSKLANDKQPEKMNQVVTLDLNALDYCSVEQLKEITALIEKISKQKTTLDNQKIYQEIKAKERQELEAKFKAHEAVSMRIVTQERFIAQQRELKKELEKEYRALKEAYVAKYKTTN